MKDATGSFSGGLYGLALLGLIASFVCAFFLHIPNPTQSAGTLAVDTHAA
jgi:ACS family tartrate transporter-like MFS transporter